MDPLGFALEHFDPIGRWRDRYRDDQPIDASGVLNDGAEISGLTGLLDYLNQHQQQFHQTLSARLLSYALGRAELASDRPLLSDLAGDLERGGTFSDLVARIVSSKQFRFRRGANVTEEFELPATREQP
jgi:hypothetical protein